MRSRTPIFPWIFQARLLHVLEALPLNGHGFRSPTVFPAAAVISPPLEPENWGHHNLLRSYMPRHNGKWEHSHREDPSVSAIHTVSILSPLWRKLLLHQFRPPPHASQQFSEISFLSCPIPLKIACDKACTRNRLYLCFFGRSMRFSPTCAEIIDR